MGKIDDMVQIQNYLLALKEVDTDGLLRQAEEAMQGMLVLNGTGPNPVFVGIPPRWEENPCGVGGYTWTMSRLRYMVTLCKAYLLIGETRYLDKVETDLADWLNCRLLLHSYAESGNDAVSCDPLCLGRREYT